MAEICFETQRGRVVLIGIQLASLQMPLKKALSTAARLGAKGIEIDARNMLPRESLSRTGLRQLRKKLEEAMSYTIDFGKSARSIKNTLENIKDPEQVENAIKEDVDKVKVLNK